MTRNLSLSFTFLCFCFVSYASFPVNKENMDKTAVETIVLDVEDQQLELGANVVADAADAISPAAAERTDDRFIITLLLWFFIGGLAAHRWYKGKPTGWNILFILTLGGLGIWWLVDGIMILTDSF